MTFGALGFLTPAILLALISLPLIWWLLRATPPAPARIRFPAFMILRRLNNEQETPDRTPWWLLLMRLLLAALVIIGLAGPVLNAPDNEPGNGPMVVVVDNSYAAAPGWSLRRTAMERTAQEARTTGRPVFIITTAEPYPPGSDQLSGPLSVQDIRDQAATLAPVPFPIKRSSAIEVLAALDAHLTRYRAVNPGAFSGPPTFNWLSDGLASPDPAHDQAFADALNQRGRVTLTRDETRDTLALHRTPASPDMPGAVFAIRRLQGGSAWTGALVATAHNGRELERTPITFAAGNTHLQAAINLPLALQNELATVRLENARSAATVWLADARDRRALIGLPNSARDQSATLLSGDHYIREALAPFAEFQTGTLTALVEAEVSVIVLDDIGRIRTQDREALDGWVTRGGILIRFAGPAFADAALGDPLPLLPIELRRGERAFGGALTWDTPQPLGEFSKDGPFSDLTVPADVFVRQQILAQPGGETSTRTWASLIDGTPLVTGIRQGNGLLVLFHITATPIWSDLPLSEVFIDMLRKLTFLSTLGPKALEETVSDQNQTRYAPLRTLDAYGRFEDPIAALSGITLTEASAPPTPLSPPGIYGSPDAPLAINTISAESPFQPLQVRGVALASYVETPPRHLWAMLFVAALLLLLGDMLATLFLGGRLGRGARTPLAAKTGTNATASTLGLFAALTLTTLIASPLAFAPPAFAMQSTSVTGPIDPPIDPRTVEATLVTRFAYVITGNAEIDRISRLGLSALSQELSRRTTVSPAPPVGINLETDDFSIYPILYWPIDPAMKGLADRVLEDVESYMRLGGLVIFDTRDDERTVANRETAEGAALRALLTRINVAPLTALSRDHVLTRSYYLLTELRGRTGINPVWVASGSSINDGVTPLIIGGRDWAGAWARSDNGNPLRPMISNRFNSGERAREMAFRSGINMAMVAFTGNYKTDQVHATILLKRLGE